MKKKPLLAIYSYILIIFLIINSATASNLPSLGNEAQSVLSLKEELIIGKTWLHQLRQAGMINQDPILTAYINNLGNILLTNINQPDLNKFNFVITTGNEINAFTFFGGNIAVCPGLITITETESELAAVLSHEISHVTQRHLSRQLLQQKKLTPITLAGAAAAAAINPYISALILGGHMQQMLNFSREHEQEADRMGIQLLIKSGFDPYSMPSIFQRLNQLNNYEQKVPEYLLSHPMFESRIPDIYNRINKANYKQHADPLAYKLIKARINVNNSNNHREHLINIERNLNKHRYNNYVALRYEQALILQLHSTSKAETILQELVTKQPDNVILQLSLAKLQATNNLNLAKNTLANLISIYPDYLPLILTYAEVLIKLKLPLEAKNLLQQYNEYKIYNLIEEPKIYELLIACFQQLNKPEESLLAQAKLLIINNNLQFAKQKVELALNAAKPFNLHAINKINKFKLELEEFIKEVKNI